MISVNPYEPPREPDGQMVQRPWNALPRVFPKYRLERVLVTLPLLVSLPMTAHDCLRGLLRDMYVYAELSGKTVTYFEPPHWDEAGWGLGGLMSLLLAAALVVSCAMNFERAPPRTPAERWLALIAVLVCFVPLGLRFPVGSEPYQSIHYGGNANAFAWTIGLALCSALIQAWYAWSRRHAAMTIFWATRQYVAFCFAVVGQRLYRRPGRP
ncbi:MAG: hypothetical protein L0211_08055 [Planctomycetaceae bacterium]|nr:hypothetical protein [Planctomycetaceae bacterium]